MIPVEYFWLVLIVVFGIIGLIRGLWKELGVTTILLLSLFVLKFGWNQIGARIITIVPAQLADSEIMAIYYTVTILFVAYISYQGFTLTFPGRGLQGITRAVFGLPGGLLNGYLIVGTIWDVTNTAKYYGFQVPLGSTGELIKISDYLTILNNTIVQYLPVTFVNEFVMAILGLILLLAIVLK
jgi:uncharacterized membrane protein required for colicin V production